MGGSSGMGSNGSGGWPAVPGGGEHVAVPSKTKMKTVRNIFGSESRSNSVIFDFSSNFLSVRMADSDELTILSRLLA